jgi:thiol:disulfide interchange protein DsbD
LLIIDGKATEAGKIITKREDVFDMNVVYFDGAANFIQVVKLKNNAKTALTGTVKFMVCNDTQCLPPTDIPFSVALQ